MANTETLQLPDEVDVEIYDQEPVCIDAETVWLPVETETLEEQDEPQRARLYRFKKCVRGVSKTLLGLSAVTGVFHIQNPEVLPALEAYVTYDEPDDDDIIPERVGCNLNNYPYYIMDDNGHELAASAEAATSAYNEDMDAAFQAVRGSESRARSFGNTSADKFVSHEPIFSPHGNYFDTFSGEYNLSLGIYMRFHKREGDLPYTINYEELERMSQDIFALRHLYEDPDVRRIMECKNDQVVEGRFLDGKSMDTNIIADGNKSFEGNNVVTRTKENNDTHSGGMGVTGIGVRVLWVKFTPDQMILVSGGNRSLEPDQSILNRRLLHELVHALVFHDLSDTISEQDEQERFVDYIEEKLVSYYVKNGIMPQAIIVG